MEKPTFLLNHFIRISPNKIQIKELLAPNQDIYLRENICLRLQLAIMAVPRQQNELYKQFLRSCNASFSSHVLLRQTQEVTQKESKAADGLSDTSIYVDVPEQLKSLTLLDKYLNRTALDVQKVEIEADKAIDTMPKADAVKPTQSESQQ